METTAAQVSRVENGERDWGKGYLEAFAHVIGCPNPTDPITRPPGAPLTLDDMLKDAPPEVRRQAFAVVETLVRTGTGDYKVVPLPQAEQVLASVEAQVPAELRQEIASALQADPRRLKEILQVVRDIGSRSHKSREGGSASIGHGKVPVGSQTRERR